MVMLFYKIIPPIKSILYTATFVQKDSNEMSVKERTYWTVASLNSRCGSLL